MPYVLGVDVGSSRMAAALCRRSGTQWAESEPLPLGADGVTCASTLYLDDAGYLVLGSEADEYAPHHPERATSDLLARVGDAAPVVLGEAAWPAEELAASAISSVVERATSQEGAPPERLALIHPAGWGAYRRDALRGALDRHGVERAVLVPEPAAASERLGVLTRVEPGSTVAVCSIGANRSSGALLRRDDNEAFQLLAHAIGGPGAAGEGLDDVLFEHLHGGQATPEPDDPAPQERLRTLRRNCEAAKRELSDREHVTVTVPGQADARRVPVTRTEFERLAAPVIDAALDTLRRAVRQAQQPAGSVVLLGGCAAIPLVRHAAAAEFGNRIVVEAAPELTAAHGACAVARRTAAAATGLPPASEQHTGVIPAAAPPAIEEQAPIFPEPMPRSPAGERPEPPPIEIAPLDLPDRRLVARFASALHPGVRSAVVVAVIAAGVVLTFVLRDGSGAAQSPLRGGGVARPSASVTAPSNPGTGAPRSHGGGP